jgi:Ribbon-helix-helix protein, copG family
MRTTLTLDDDVAARIERLRRARDESFKEIVNDALRRGLQDMSAPERKRKPFRTQPIHGVKLLLDNVDNVAEVLAYLDGYNIR